MTGRRAAGVGEASTSGAPDAGGADTAAGAADIAAPDGAATATAGTGPTGSAAVRATARSFRTDEATSARGKSRATSNSASCLVRPDAAATSCSWLTSVKCRAISRSVVRFREPSARRSRTSGNRPAARAASMMEWTPPYDLIGINVPRS